MKYKNDTMYQQNQLKQAQQTALLIKRGVVGGGIALLLITVFLLGVKNPDPAWPRFWMVRPLIIVPMAGIGGGIFFHFMTQLGRQRMLPRTAAVIIGLVGFIVALWLGSVLGLDGTLWN
jgi:hypothetical protein